MCGHDLFNDNAVSWFIEIPILDQLQTLFRRKHFYSSLSHHLSRNTSDTISDIYDGNLYKEFCKSHDSCSSEFNISFMWYTDVVPLFKSSKVSMWPLFFVINELPYEKRFLKENMVYAGIWVGEGKPIMNSFMKPFHDTLEKLKGGFSVEVPNTEVVLTVKASLLFGSCDLPAKCQMLNMIQFNGAYGCAHCLQTGKSVSTGSGHTWVYPYNVENPCGPKRTTERFHECAKQAYYSGKVVEGVKGPNFLSLTGFDLVRGTGIDYMHTVLLGVTRKVLSLWFASSNSKEIFSLSKYVKYVDRRLFKYSTTKIYHTYSQKY